MAQKCVHKGCGKQFTDPEEDCVYHPGPPIFHEGQKGWKCCKPRVLTFEEFLEIPPCTTGKHSTVDDTPAPPEKPKEPMLEPDKELAMRPAEKAVPVSTGADTLAASSANAHSPTPEPTPVESESDDPSAEVPENASCRRKGCHAKYTPGSSRDEEECTHHPGQPIFHEGTKGWSCCKRRVLEFDEFMKIVGCKTKKRHLFIEKEKKGGEEKVEDVRTDFYQTGTTVIVSFYLKKIDKAAAKIQFTSPTTIDFDLPTTDKKRFKTTYELFAPIDTEQSNYKIMGTKMEMTLVKADGTSWPVLRKDDKRTGEIIQAGRAKQA